ncbi:ribonuclease H-like domain-containing protein [Tanacetum coccineum]
MSVHNSEHNSPNNSDSVTRISKLDISDPLHLHPNDTTDCSYFVSIKKLKKQYDAMIGLPKCVCNASKGFKKHNQLLKLMQFLMGLDDSYMQIRSSILSRETLPDVRSAYATISSEESHRVAVGSIASSLQRNQASAFVSNVPNSGGSGLNINRPSGGSDLVCENYGFNGHTIHRCVKIIRYPADFGKKKSGQNFKKQKANQHMTYTDKELDNVLDISHLKIKVGHPNGTKAYIFKIGNIRLSNGLTLYDVMVIPEYRVTLIYVHKLIIDNKVIVAYDENKCYFLNQYLNLKNVLEIGEQCEGLYYSNDKGIKSNTGTLRFQCMLSQHDWHCRLGHPADLVLNVLKDSLNIDKKDNTVRVIVAALLCLVAISTLLIFQLIPDSSNDFVATQNEEVATLEENVFSEGNLDKNPSSSQGVQNVRREPKTYFEASKYSHWTDAINQEIDALLRNGTWELVDLQEGRKAIGKEVVFMKPPEGYFPFDNKSDKGVFLALLVYVDDIIITGNSVSEIEKFKVFLKSKFMIKDLGKLKYFLGIEVVDTDKGICLNQRKYVLDLLSEYGMLACKPAKTPLMSKLVISNEASDKDPLLENITDYQKLMGKLIYLTNTRPDISYVVHCLSQFMHSPLTSHLKIAFKILRYLKSCPGLGVHVTKTSGMFLTAYSDDDWAKCKKQNTFSKSLTEAEYRSLASVTSEVIWILNFLKDLQMKNLLPVSLHCDSNSAIKIVVNPVFHERTKHLEIDLHFVREKVLKRVVKTVKVDSTNQIADILTKGLDTVHHLELIKKLGMYDVYQVETKGGILRILVSIDERLRAVAAKFATVVKLLYKLD